MIEVNKGLSPAERAALDNASAGAVTNAIKVNAVTSLISTTTEDMIAPKNLTAGDVVINDEILYKAIVNIAEGSRLIEGSNVVKCTLTEWIASLTA